jgi:Ca2+:H+ antiporter
MRGALKPSLNWLLPLTPIAIAVRLAAPDAHVWLFFLASIAIVPLAGWMGKATEHLAARTGEGIGGLLNATFGNMAEIIIAIMALREGLTEIVKASLTGSIIGNALLVLGASMLGGGLKFKIQEFNPAGGRTRATQLTLAAIALLVPALFHHLAGPAGPAREGALSLEISILILIVYALALVFSLHTHERYFTRETAEAVQLEDETHASWSVRRSLGILVGATLLVSALAEILVASVETTAATLGMTEVFVGVIVVAIVGNAAEHSTAILMAIEDRMDLAIGIAIGSATQIALFAAPVLVLLSYVIGPAPMDLLFWPGAVVMILVATLTAALVTNGGRSAWFVGALINIVYLVFAMTLYLLPPAAEH